MQIKCAQEPTGLACVEFSSEIHLQQDGWKTPSLPGRVDDIRPLKPKTLSSEQVSLQQPSMPRKLPIGTDVIQLTCQEDSHRCPLTCCPRPLSNSVHLSTPTWDGCWPLKPTHTHHPFIPSQQAHSQPVISPAALLKSAGLPGPPLEVGSCHTIFPHAPHQNLPDWQIGLLSLFSNVTPKT